jgi:hypothetical protein
VTGRNGANFNRRRWVYYRYMDKSNWWRYFWLIDGWSKKRLGNMAKTHYKSIYAAFAQFVSLLPSRRYIC